MRLIPFPQYSCLKTQKITQWLSSFVYLEESHKNMSHPKKLKLSIRSENKKYSEWVEKGSSGSGESWFKKELRNSNEEKKEEKVRRNFFHLESIRSKRMLNIHWFLLFIVNCFVTYTSYLPYFQHGIFSHIEESRFGGVR
jgi:hypothetical protein